MKKLILSFIFGLLLAAPASTLAQNTDSLPRLNQSLNFKYAFDAIGHNYLFQYERGLNKDGWIMLTSDFGYGNYNFEHKNYFPSSCHSFVFTPGLKISTFKNQKKYIPFDAELKFNLLTTVGSIFDLYIEQQKFR